MYLSRRRVALCFEKACIMCLYGYQEILLPLVNDGPFGLVDRHIRVMF